MALYLSRLTVDALAAPAKAYPSDIRRVHSLVYSLFAQPTAERILWSDETDRLNRTSQRGAGKQILVLSKVRPQLKPQQQGWLALSTVELKETFLQHRKYAFKLKANCVKNSFSRSRDERGIITAIVLEPELRAWLDRKLTAGGCRLLCCREIRRRSLSFMHKSAGGTASRASFNAVTFSGELAVDDNSSFRSMLESGIGRGKAFGFGLLQIVPLE